MSARMFAAEEEQEDDVGALRSFSKRDASQRRRRSSVLDLIKPAKPSSTASSPAPYSPAPFVLNATPAIVVRRASVAALPRPAVMDLPTGADDPNVPARWPAPAVVKTARRHSIASFITSSGSGSGNLSAPGSPGRALPVRMRATNLDVGPNDLFDTTSPFSSTANSKAAGDLFANASPFSTVSPFSEAARKPSFSPSSPGSVPNPFNYSFGKTLSPNASPVRRTPSPASPVRSGENSDDELSPTHGPTRRSVLSPSGFRQLSEGNASVETLALPEGVDSTYSLQRSAGNVLSPEPSPGDSDEGVEFFDFSPTNEEEDAFTTISKPIDLKTDITIDDPPLSGEQGGQSEMFRRFMQGDSDGAMDLMFQRFSANRGDNEEDDEDDSSSSSSGSDDSSPPGSRLSRQKFRDFDDEADETESRASEDLDVIAVDDEIKLHETILVLAQSQLEHRVSIARSLPLWLEHVNIADALIHILPLLRSLGEDGPSD